MKKEWKIGEEYKEKPVQKGSALPRAPVIPSKAVRGLCRLKASRVFDFF